jgi:thiosulfate dehydrogenase [quinone] large subunit
MARHTPLDGQECGFVPSFKHGEEAPDVHPGPRALDHSPPIRTPQTTGQCLCDPARPASTRTRALGVLRIVMGLTFLWAFVDKMFGLGYATSPAQAWIHGGSPTKGFLAHVEVGPFQSILRG